MFSKKPAIAPGSRVAYSKKFLKDINLEAGELSGARGTVKELVGDKALVNWDESGTRSAHRDNLRVVA